MKDKSSIASNLIDRNWVLKRKRGKLHPATGLSNRKGDTSAARGSVNSDSSAKHGGKSEAKAEGLSSKKKGNDGYFYECVICDLGGELLCCDSCPRTYHKQCLDPPLKRIPTGKWQCPKCQQKADSRDPISHLSSVSRRARTKVATVKSRSGDKTAGSGKVSQIFENCVAAEKRRTSKELSVERASGSPTKEMLSSSNHAKEEPNDETSEENPKCDDGSSGSKLNISCDDRAETTRKRRIEFDYRDRRKKHKKNKEKNDAQVSEKHVSKAYVESSATGKLDKKRKSSDQGESLSKKDSAVRSSNALKKAEKRLENKAKKADSHMVEIPTCENNSTGEFLQVDRVLGCRVQGDSTNSSCHISMMVTDDQPSNEMLISENGSRLSGQSPTCDNDTEAVPRETSVENNHNLTKGLEGEDIMKNDMEADKIHFCKSMAKDLNGHAALDFSGKGTKDSAKHSNGEAPVDFSGKGTKDSAKDSNGEAAVDFSGKGTKDSGSTAVADEHHSEYAKATEDSVIVTEKTMTDKKKDFDLTSHDDNATPKAYKPHDSCQDTDAKDADKEVGVSISSGNKIQEPSCSEAAHGDKKTLQYEFLVKWVGKSHIHNTWISEAEVKVLAKRKLDNYKARYGTTAVNICEEKWKRPQRVLALRALKDGTKEAFIKWTGLPYDECTWERFDEPVIRNSSHLIDLYYQFEEQTLGKDAAEDLRRKKDRRQKEIETLTEQPKELKGGSLFPHQLEALNWLRKCWHRSRNVILADEMGLGKTVSACAFISSLYFEFKAVLPCLVLVPLSTMPNWLAEFASWAPDLNVVEYHGSAKARAIIRQYEWHANDPNGLHKKTSSYKFNVLLTTYEMILADLSHLRGVPWEVLVVDEGHRLKNSDSKLFSSLNTFSFQHRVLLTGTPLQNNIGEMYNLLNFLQPASFPSLASFEDKFKDLTTADKVEELKKLVAPHMLRRLKKDTMQNIPPKTERMVPVELSSIQAEYYRAMLTKNYQILRNIGKKGVQSMLNIVMQLRKVCNHPYLIPGTEPESGSVEFLHEMRIKASAKLTLLHSMLKVLNREGHRVLIFSQMTKLLDILEDYLSFEFGPKTYERVDGSVAVADRQAAIARFNQDKSRFVFLLSTRSCGLGINLATADTVIIYDSDFNPHADIQAMNRAHRIGQSKTLLVYRLVVRASVEERILQLAKKKLMLDQLFVNKSESQKEVENILRWGTEELFRDAPNANGRDIATNNNNEEAFADLEHKHRKRSGGLGDVYKDKCTEGGNKIVWDEDAILKLLDRSNLQSGSSDNAEGELENDMLGAVKSLEWNDEQTEELRDAESPFATADDTCAENSDRKEENAAICNEENEWDRLLRVRWEKYQSEEEAALGRGKRQRKAVSYREAYASTAHDTLSESGGDEEREPEPEREYTAAGRALKEKYAKLRARQKERIARRNSVVDNHHGDGECGPESHPQHPLSDNRGQETGGLAHPPREKSLVTQSEDNKSVQVSDVPRSKNESPSKMIKLPKQRTMNSNIDLSINSLGQPSTKNLRSTTSTSTQPSSENLCSTESTNLHLSPVLGLCAPNANQFQSSRRNVKRSVDKQSRPETRLEFPFNLPPSGSSVRSDLKGLESRNENLRSQEAPSEVLQHRNKSNLDNCLPISLYPPVVQQGKGLNAPEAITRTSDFRDQMALPRLPFNEKLLPRFPVSTKGTSTPHYEFLPPFPFGSRQEATSGSIQDMPTVPLLPNFKFPSMEAAAIHNQQEREVLPPLGLGQMTSPFSSLPENHKKVLENIMMRTGSGSSNIFKGKRKLDTWSEDELDSLWIGVRRHGRGNWFSMLRDPRLRFSKFKTAEDLAAKWGEEELKILEVPKSTKSSKSTKASGLPGLSDGMMERALRGSRLAAPLKFQPHLTDMKLGFTDMPPNMSPFELGHLGQQNDLFGPLSSLNLERYRNFAGDSAGRPSGRHGTLPNIPVEKPTVPTSSGSVDLGYLGMNCSSSFDVQQKDDHFARYRKLPGILGRSLDIVRNSQHNFNGESSSSVLLENSKGINITHSKEAIAEGSSSKDKLPHWLRDAVSTSTKLPDPELPSTVSAVAQSVRLLYGEEKPTIPPFEIPGPAPPQPKDPRQSLKKKKKSRSHSLHKAPSSVAGSYPNSESGTHTDNGASSSIPMAPLFPLIPESIRGTSGCSLVESNLNLPPFTPSTSSANINLPKVSSMGLSPSPEVLKLVATCVAPGPLTASVSGFHNSSFLESSLPAQMSLDRTKYPDLLPGSDKKTARESSPHHEQGLGEGREQHNSEDSSKTESNPSQTKQPDIEEISSEETVSDHPTSDHEP